MVEALWAEYGKGMPETIQPPQQLDFLGGPASGLSIATASANRAITFPNASGMYYSAVDKAAP